MLFLVAALAVTAFADAARSGEGQAARSNLTLIAPAAAGGGWDLVAREAQQAMRVLAADSVDVVTHKNRYVEIRFINPLVSYVFALFLEP